MKRKDYQRPTMKVVPLKHKCQILAGSAKRGQLVNPDDYLLEGDPFEF